MTDETRAVAVVGDVPVGVFEDEAVAWRWAQSEAGDVLTDSQYDALHICAGVPVGGGVSPAGGLPDGDQRPGLDDPIPRAVGLCREYADELFGGDPHERYTQVTAWTDGDFEVRVKHGKGHDMGTPRRRLEEVVTYRHFDGWVVYADQAELVDRHRFEYEETKRLERPPFAAGPEDNASGPNGGGQ